MRSTRQDTFGSATPQAGPPPWPRGSLSGRQRPLRAGRPRNGSAYLIALLLLAVFTTIGLAMASVANTQVRQAQNGQHVMDARLAAESGLAFMLNTLQKVRLPGTTTQETFGANMAAALTAKLQETPNLQGATITVVAGVVSVPAIHIGDRTFSCWFTWVSQSVCRLKVKGASGSVSRYLTLDFSLTPKTPGAFDYGIASRGQVSIFGSAKVVGVNYMTEASVLSATATHADAIHIDGSATVSGDLFTADEDAYVSISGNPTVAGSRNPVEIAKHIHQGVGEPDFPQIDVAPVAVLATYTLQPSDPTNKGVLDNVRIPAGMNPHFTSDVVLNGVVYVEAPNIVKFDGKCTLNGLIVTQTSTNPLGTCQLKFDGHVEANGVSVLPSTPQFASVKQKTGTFILAPGFGVTFAGNFSAINGTIAAEQLTFTGTAEGIVKGSVIGLADYLTSIGGNVEIKVDRSGADPNPAGFVKSFALIAIADSYTEVTP